jgi:hypothetical protein
MPWSGRMILVVVAAMSALAGGCRKRASGEINVDETQGYVNEVETNLRSMRAALREKNISKATDSFEQAREVFKDNSATLANYPEIGELKSSMIEGEKSLCYGAVDIALKNYFDAVRAKELKDAQSLLQFAQKEFGRCEAKIKNRDDFMPLKMNLDTAPQSLVTLERELARPAMLEKLHAFQKEQDGRLASSRTNLAALEKQPNQAELDLALRAEIQEQGAALEAQKDFADEPEWVRFRDTRREALKELEGRRVVVGSRGRVKWLAATRLPAATQAAARAALGRKPEESIKVMTEVAAAYKECEEILEEGQKRDPALAKMTVPFLGAQRSVPWLLRHCGSERQRTERLVDRLSGKPPAPEKPAVEAAPPPPEAKDPKAPPKKPPPKKRRIKRW